ncbi:hypothetical protein MCHI_000316 [Candidatus Magnetoovum chiemensis]|nr:hypothetical protein MCHI_000316 [Candidatus Magnetoovum chiemensis]
MFSIFNDVLLKSSPLALSSSVDKILLRSSCQLLSLYCSVAVLTAISFVASISISRILSVISFHLK